MSDASHSIYAKADPKDADAVAWAFTSKDNFEKYYFKFPALGDNEVRARILYTSLCMTDSHIGRGRWGAQCYPVCTGHEVVGEAVAVGDGVKSIKVGDKVSYGPYRDSCGKCEWCKKGWTHACADIAFGDKCLYGKYFGGYATHIQQPEALCFKLTDNLKLETAPPLLCAGITVYLPLALYYPKEQKKVKVAVYAIGGLGHLAIQYAAKMGAEVTAFTTSKNKESLIKELGAHKVVLWDDFYKQDKDKIEKEYDLILNTLPVWASQDKVDKWVASLAPYGKLCLLGVSSLEDPMVMDVRALVFDHRLVIGSFVGGRKHTEEMLKFSADNNIDVKCEYYDFEDFPKALEKLEKGQPQFRCVVKVEDAAKELEKNWK